MDDLILVINNKLKNYESTVEKIKNEINQNEITRQYATSSIGLLEGYYSPSKFDLFAKGTKRGHILNGYDELNTRFIYYFDINNKIISIDSISSGMLIAKEYIEYDGDSIYGYWYDLMIDTSLLRRITCSFIDKGKIREYAEVVLVRDEVRNLLQYQIDKQQFEYSSSFRIIYESGLFDCKNNSYHIYNKQLLDNLDDKKKNTIKGELIWL